MKRKQETGLKIVELQVEAATFLLGKMLFISLEKLFFNFHDVIKCLSIKQELHFTKYLGK